MGDEGRGGKECSASSIKLQISESDLLSKLVSLCLCVDGVGDHQVWIGVSGSG